MSVQVTDSCLQIHQGWTEDLESIVQQYTPHTCPEAAYYMSLTRPGFICCSSGHTKAVLTHYNALSQLGAEGNSQTLYFTLSTEQETAILRVDVKPLQAANSELRGIQGYTKCFLFSQEGTFQAQRKWDIIPRLSSDRESLQSGLSTHFEQILAHGDKEVSRPSFTVLSLFQQWDSSLIPLVENLATAILASLTDPSEMSGVQPDVGGSSGVGSDFIQGDDLDMH